MLRFLFIKFSLWGWELAINNALRSRNTPYRISSITTLEHSATDLTLVDCVFHNMLRFLFIKFSLWGWGLAISNGLRSRNIAYRIFFFTTLEHGATDLTLVPLMTSSVWKHTYMVWASITRRSKNFHMGVSTNRSLSDFITLLYWANVLARSTRLCTSGALPPCQYCWTMGLYYHILDDSGKSDVQTPPSH